MRITMRGVAVSAALLVVSGLASPASATAGGPPMLTPAAWTPQIATSGTDGTVEQIRQLVTCGETMYAVGTFTDVKRYTTSYTRSNAFSFSATTGAVSSWAPVVNGTVNTVGLSPDCATAYLGGAFTSVNGTAVKNLVAVSTSTGAIVPGFGTKASGQVSSLVVTGGHVIVGGYFSGVNGSTRPYLISLNPATGKDDGYVALAVSGNYVYTDDNGRASKQNSTRVYNFTLSPDGSRLLAMGVFTSVGGQPRRQIVMLDLGASGAAVDPWYSPEFDQNCATVEPFWLQDAAWSPDGQTVYIATTGYKPANGPGFRTSQPRAGLCDAAAAFSSAPVPTQAHLWVNYTGCDSLFSTAADSSTVYVGGHERWASNPNQCDNNSNGTAVTAPGLAGFSPVDGSVTYNPTRGRGLGADDMLVTPAGLWIASDNAQNTDQCAGVSGHAGICFLPY